jgi:hypothetical protein
MRSHWAVLAVLSLVGGTSGATTNASARLVIRDSVIIVDSLKIIVGTDSVFRRGQLLVRGTDYSLEGVPLRFRYSGYQPQTVDTIEIRYRRWPEWLSGSWGNPILPATAVQSTIPKPTVATDQTKNAGAGGAVEITGAKTFRVTSGPGVGSAFGQSLDLAIAGKLSPGVRIDGAISDRGYEPINGYANSRLDEFDRLRLRVSSQQFVGQAGDISLKGLSPLIRPRDVSGGSVRVGSPTVSAFGAASRPRGRFQSVKLNGNDSFQGPYQPTGAIVAIVPGSEEVWLDGRRLERGVDRDYTIDYPTGRIAFGVTRPIDSRSRIEIDFEPAGTPYRQELFVGGAEIRSADSSRSLAVAFTREGDDKDRPLTEISGDGQSALAQSSDSVTQSSGVTVDSLGAYQLLPDSLPDTVWQYVGVGDGEYHVRFSFVGAQRGRYRYVGNDQYLFVGASQGDYDPVILLYSARRVESVRALAKSALWNRAEATADIRFSRTSFNLWNPNATALDGAYHDIAFSQRLGKDRHDNAAKLRRQSLESTYSANDRVDEPDLTRLFLAPVGLQWSGRRIRHDAEVSTTVAGRVTLSPYWSQAKFGDKFLSKRYGGGAEYRPTSQWTVSAQWQDVRAEFDTLGTSRKGRGSTGSGMVKYVSGQYSLISEFEYDKRTNSYRGPDVGTKYLQGTFGAGAAASRITYEGYVEDTLVGVWRENLKRHRLSASSSGALGNWRTDFTATHQWLDQPTGRERSFLGRFQIGLDDQRRHLSFSSGYLLSDERRNAHGFTYLKVDPGRGNYRFEDGRYIADPFGDYLRVEELLSETERVRRGEKTFRLDKQAEGYQLSASSRIVEELLADGQRRWWWAAPFLSDENAAYLSYERQYQADIRAVRWRSVYAMTLSVSANRESRAVQTENRVRSDLRVRGTLRQPAGRWVLEQGVERFESRRDQFYGDAGKSDGWKGAVGVRGNFDATGVLIEAAYRRAQGNADNSDVRETSKLYTLILGGRRSFQKRGEVKLDTEFYRQTFENLMGYASTLLTDNHEGTRGWVWTLSANYGLSRTVKFTMALNGRNSDNRRGRLFARSEMTAAF